MPHRHIALSEPDLSGSERDNLLSAFDSTWISSSGEFIATFEENLAKFAGTTHAIVTNNGTTALHLTMVACGIRPGDEVIIPAVTYISVANVVSYVGATPVLVDVEPRTLNIDVELVAAAITPRTRAIIAVHSYGIPADVSELRRLADTHGLALIEDCAEAHGAQVDIGGQVSPVGSVGDLGMFSFFGNKIMTTGEGGAVTTNDDALAAQVRQLRGQGMDLARRYWFPMIGYNYRMTNVAAALGVAQLSRFTELDQRRRELNEIYQDELSQLPVELTPGATDTHSAPWLRNVFVAPQHRDSIMLKLADYGIETRPVFIPLYELPPYKNEQGAMRFPVAHEWAYRGISLPLHTKLSADDVQYVCASLAHCLA